MEFIDLAEQQRRIRSDIEKGIMSVLDHGNYIMGPETKELEKRLCEYVGTRRAVCCASGTDALLMSLMALDVGPGDAIFTTPFTFIATAEVIALLGATPVFVDIDPVTFNIDPKQLEKAIDAMIDNRRNDYPATRVNGLSGLKPRGVIAVDLFGLPADYGEINRIGGKYGLFVIEDAAQSFGAEYHGKRACGLADIGCTSFFPAKPLGCYGDGGMCFTDDDELASLMESIRVHGKGLDKYDNVRIGINGRLDTIQAAILLAKFQLFHAEMKMRNDVANGYNRRLARLSAFLRRPFVPEKCVSIWAQYTVVLDYNVRRDKLQKELLKKGIPTAIYYPKPLHLQAAFRYLGYKKGAFQISEQIADRVISLPMHPYLKEADQDEIVDELEKVFLLG
jgi:UDP-2-acetamido-2-deoxy-ribo-hexuluronate aminotransferase